MTDYFALLEQPRRPWLDPEQLKESFHARTLRSHPDALPGDATVSGEGAFAELNEAYQVLRDPKRRLQHLLALQGDSPSSQSGSIPEEIENLFPVVADLTLESDKLIHQLGGATSPLSRSLLKPQVIATAKRITDVLQRLRTLFNDAEGRLQETSEGTRSEDRIADLHALYLEFSYLTKWIAQLDEKQFQLAL